MEAGVGATALAGKRSRSGPLGLQTGWTEEGRSPKRRFVGQDPAVALPHGDGGASHPHCDRPSAKMDRSGGRGDGRGGGQRGALGLGLWLGHGPKRC